VLRTQTCAGAAFLAVDVLLLTVLLHGGRMLFAVSPPVVRVPGSPLLRAVQTYLAVSAGRRDPEYNIAMLVLILAAVVLLPYGIYRATRRWGLAVLWYVAAAASALDATGVVAERLWSPRYSWNFAHHGWNALPTTLISLFFSAGMALWFCNRHMPRTR